MNHVPLEEMVRRLIAKTGLSDTQIRRVMQAQAELAYEMAEAGYPLPGIGVLTITEREARAMVMRFGPSKGKEVVLPAKRVLKLVVAKAAKEVVLRSQATPSDVFAEPLTFEDLPGEP